MTDLTALPEDIPRQHKPLEYLQRSVHDPVEVLAGAHSGAQGLLALTSSEAVFAWKPPGLGTTVKTFARNRTEILGVQLDGADLLIRFRDRLLRYKNVQPPGRAQAIFERLTAAGARPTVTPDSSDGPARAALNIVPTKTRQIAEQLLRADENVHAVFVGAGAQAMIAADNRIIVIKTGFMAGATFGQKTLDFAYDQISGIELHVGAMTGYLQITSPAFQGNLPGSYWSKDKHDPWKLPNCIPIGRAATTTFQPTLALVRERIAKGYWADGISTAPPAENTPPATSPATNRSLDLAGQLKELGELRDQGVLSDEEFQQAKAKLLA